MIAYNAQPAAMTADMWARNYLSQINEIAALLLAHVIQTSKVGHLWGLGSKARAEILVPHASGVPKTSELLPARMIKYQVWD